MPLFQQGFLLSWGYKNWPLAHKGIGSALSWLPVLAVSPALINYSLILPCVWKFFSNLCTDQNKFVSLSLFFFWPSHVTCGTLVPSPGMEPRPPVVEAWSPKHWTDSEFWFVSILKDLNGIRKCKAPAMKRKTAHWSWTEVALFSSHPFSCLA